MIYLSLRIPRLLLKKPNRGVAHRNSELLLPDGTPTLVGEARSTLSQGT